MWDSNVKWAADFLERNGWTREVAGDYDFNLAAKAVAEFRAKPGKWLMLMGCVGVGKTHLADIIFDHLAGDKIKIDCAEDGQVDYLVGQEDAEVNGGVYSSGVNDYLDKSIFLDDVGRESIKTHFGNTLNRVGKFLAKYYNRGKRRVIITTNFDGEALSKRFGDALFDRILDKAIVIKFTGKSKRERNIFK